MSNPNMEIKVKELLELKRMKEELEAEITAMEEDIKRIMGDEETLLAGVFKVSWKAYTSTRFDSVRFKKEHAELAAAYTKQTTARRFSIN
jgi:predicted phage-related endonuclease